MALLPGERVLDLGCGIGDTPQAIAEAVGEDGYVLGMDVIQSAIDVARSCADNPPHLDFACGDVETYQFSPGSFDAAFSRFGTMFFSEPVAAFPNLRKAIRAGGRIAFVCWRDLAANELDHLPRPRRRGVRIRQHLPKRSGSMARPFALCGRLSARPTPSTSKSDSVGGMAAAACSPGASFGRRFPALPRASCRQAGICPNASRRAPFASQPYGKREHGSCPPTVPRLGRPSLRPPRCVVTTAKPSTLVCSEPPKQASRCDARSG